MSTNAELNAKILDFAQVAGEFGAEARKVAEDGLTACKEASALVDQTADSLIQASLVDENERGEVLKLASTHAGALKLAGNLVQHIGKVKQAHDQQTAQGKLGRGAGSAGSTKEASAKSTESVVVGQRAGLGEKRASDEALLRGLGISTEDIGRG
ncbi:MAG: hypothetical protein ACYSWU_04310 [Planctomycetota bacterium]|jgi:hypothetical protein